ncbi:MAG: glycosyltransferase family 2 protein [Lachnospiraceae bacterium]|nr:glycosyltransferase family 2 protein [Lachnospiraceae bacterium]
MDKSFDKEKSPLKKLTVFTPVYNRADMLPDLYNSLTGQTNKDFVWLVVDDGSTDDSFEVLKSFEAEGKIEMRICRQENGGKMRAHNRGVELAETELFVCLDSDDRFTIQAVSDILGRWEKVSENSSFAGIVANKGESEERPLYGENLPQVTEDTLSGLYRKGFKGETTLIYRTEVLRKYPFPEIEGEKYVPEDVVYDEIDREYTLSVMDEILTICTLRDDGLTDRAAELRRKNPGGWYIYYVNRAGNTEFSLLKIKYISHYLRFRPLVSRELKERYSLSPLLSVLGIPGAIVLSLMNKR